MRLHKRGAAHTKRLLLEKEVAGVLLSFTLRVKSTELGVERGIKTYDMTCEQLPHAVA